MENETGYTMERLTEMLQQKGIRPTAQRIAVLSAVAKGRTHPSAEEIYGRLSTVFRSLSRTTVYNSLGILVEHGVLRELEIEAGCWRYDLGGQAPHSHFVCRSCGCILDLPMPRGVAEGVDPQFDIDSVDITYRGLCPQCRQKVQPNNLQTDRQ